MHRKREITRIKREEIKRLKDYLTVLQQRLERYLRYGSGPKRFPLVDVLQYALKFVSNKPVCTSPIDDIHASSPFSGSIPSQTSPSTTELQGAPSSELPSTSPPSVSAVSSRSVIHKPFTQSRIPPDLPMHPAPRHITEEELSVLESCLYHWRTEIENDAREELNKETGQALVGIETLPPDLRDFVEEDNQRFEKELEEWDAQLAQKALQEKLLASQKLRESESSVTTVQAGKTEYLEQPSRNDFSKHLKEETTFLFHT